MAGVITHVHAVEGESVAPGTLLFQIRITAEALVATQTELLKTVGEIDVENREIARLAKATEGGAIPQKSLLERQYAKEKLEVLMGAHKEALRLQGLSERQIEDIVTNRKLLRELQIVAPHPDDHSHEEFKLTEREVTQASYQADSASRSAAPSARSEEPLVLQEVLVHKGQTVAAGQTLGVVADYSELYIEGQAFEQDIRQLTAAAQRGWRVTALMEDTEGSVSVIPDLELVFLANAIHTESRTFHFFVRLANEIVKRTQTPDGQSFVVWKYRLGQRLRLQLPVEEWTDRIVLPVEAVAREGADYFVFQQNGDHFDRVPVKVDYRDSRSVVVANDGSIFPGDVIAMRGAHQMQMALKNKSGGGGDPHAGHTH
jgi:multidrug efflux pump subunit AcrA (membrane-fusion protein)